jgi:hypothetical protein
MSEIKQEKKEATSIKINPELWKEAKIEAIREGKTVSELLEQAVQAWIDKQRAKMKK